MHTVLSLQILCNLLWHRYTLLCNQANKTNLKPSPDASLAKPSVIHCAHKYLSAHLAKILFLQKGQTPWTCYSSSSSTVFSYICRESWPCSVAVGTVMAIYQSTTLVQTTTTIGPTAMKFVCGSWRMHCSDFSDPLTFSLAPSSGQSLSNTLGYLTK